MITSSDIINILTPILKKHAVKEAILFGSYAKGCASDCSDVDLYVDSGLRGIRFFELLGDICDALPVSVDLFDKRMLLSNPDFQNEIYNTGVNICL